VKTLHLLISGSFYIDGNDTF